MFRLFSLFYSACARSACPDEIPAELARLPKLQMLHLANNKLSGTRTAWLSLRGLSCTITSLPLKSRRGMFDGTMACFFSVGGSVPNGRVSDESVYK